MSQDGKATWLASNRGSLFYTAIYSVIFYVFLTFGSMSLVLNDRGSEVLEGACSLVG